VIVAHHTRSGLAALNVVTAACRRPGDSGARHVQALRLLKKYVDNRQLVIGGQSGSDRVLQAMHRGHSVEDVRRAVRACVEAGFVPTWTSCSACRAKRPGPRPVHRLRRELVDLAPDPQPAFMPLPGTPLSGALPEPIEEPARLALERLESRGAMHGQWRAQRRIAQDWSRSGRLAIEDDVGVADGHQPLPTIRSR